MHHFVPGTWMLAALVFITAISCGPSASVAPNAAPAQPAPVLVAPADVAPEAHTDQAVVPSWNHGDAAVPVTPEDPLWGNPLAPVTIVVFTDLECPFSKRYFATLQSLQQRYGPEKLRIVLKHYPLPFHRQARPAAIAASAVHGAAGPDAFWKFVETVFANQKQIDEASLEAWARQAGVDPDAYRQALKDPRHAAKVDKDVELASKLGVQGTPNSFVNGTDIGGAQPLDKVQAIVDEQMQIAQTLIARGMPADRVYVIATHDAYEAPAPKDEPAEEPADVTEHKVPVGSSPARGPRTALVTVVVFSDFQCAYCKRAEATLEELLQRYPDDVRVVWKDRPLPFHQWAKRAAVFARVARAQRGDAGFWAAHDKLFENQPNFEDADLERYAKDLKLNYQLIKLALERNTYDRPIQQDIDLADQLTASGTPHFFINGRRLVGAQPIESFVDIVDEQLVKARAAVQSGVARAQVYDHLQKNATVPPPPPPPERKTIPLPTANQPSRGGRYARIIIQQFSDFQCPFCGRVEPTIDQVLAKYGNRVRLVWRQMPLPFHRDAQLAAEASVEVFRQKGNTGFWAFHQKLFENQRALDRASLETYAAEVGADMTAFRDALDRRTHKAAVEADMQIAENAGIRGTPSFTINGYFVSGAQPIEAFEKMIEYAIQHP